MADEPRGVAPRNADANKLIDQTQPAALRLLDDRALGALLKDLRAMKAQEADRDLQKLLAQAIRRAADERQARAGAKGAAADEGEDEGRDGNDQPASAARVPGTAVLKDKLSKAEKAEARARKEAEKAEKRRVRDAEKAERKATRAAGGKAGGQARDKASKAEKGGKGGKGKGQGRARAAADAPPPGDEPGAGGAGGAGL